MNEKFRKTHQSGVTVAALLASVIAIAMSTVAAAQVTAKGPPGSQDKAIEAAAYCVGQELVRGGKAKEALDLNTRQTADLKSGSGNYSAEDRRKNLDRTELSASYLLQKLAYTSSEMGWMYRMLTAIGNSVQSPDPKILNTSMDHGKADGTALSNIEEQCRASCSEAGSIGGIAMCVDTCAENKDARLAKTSKQCDALYEKSTK